NRHIESRKNLPAVLGIGKGRVFVIKPQKPVSPETAETAKRRHHIERNNLISAMKRKVRRGVERNDPLLIKERNVLLNRPRCSGKREHFVLFGGEAAIVQLQIGPFMRILRKIAKIDLQATSRNRIVGLVIDSWSLQRAEFQFRRRDRVAGSGTNIQEQ